jgi:hypothetical protein
MHPLQHIAIFIAIDTGGSRQPCPSFPSIAANPRANQLSLNTIEAPSKPIPRASQLSINTIEVLSDF